MTPTAAVKLVNESAAFHGKTVEKFLLYMGISRVTWWRWRTKKVTPDPRIIEDIQQANERLKERRKLSSV